MPIVSRRSRRRDILAPYLVGRRDASGSRRGQGQILTWDPLTGDNTVSFRGREYINMPFQMFGTVPAYTGGDIVVIDGWAPEGRLSSWYIVGRVAIPPVTAPET